MNKISVVMNTLNEELNIPFSLGSIADFADEIIVVDMHSTDDTRKIAREGFKAKVYKHVRTDYVESARNFAIKKATGDWILILDADEDVPKTLIKKLNQIVKNPKADYYRIPRQNYIFGKVIKHSRWWPDYNIRFFKKGSVFWTEKIHGVPETYGKGLDLPAKTNLAIFHRNYKYIEQYVDRMNRYTTVQASQLIKDKYKFNSSDLIKKPTSEFVSRYFQGEGYKDGVHGLVLAGLQACSEFILYLKVWLHPTNKNRKIKTEKVISLLNESQKEINHWKADLLVKEKGGIVNRIKRRFKLP